MFLPHWDFLPSPLGKDCSSLYYWGRNFLPFPTAEGVFFTSPLWLGKEFSSLYYWGRNFLPFITGERIFFPFAPRKESSLLPRCGWEGISFPSYWGRNFLPFLLGKKRALWRLFLRILNWLKPWSFRGRCPLDPHQGLCPWTPPGALKRAPGPHAVRGFVTTLPCI